MSEMKDNGKRGRDEDGYDSDVSVDPKRVLAKCMSHDYTLLNSELDIYEYISCMKDNTTRKSVV